MDRHPHPDMKLELAQEQRRPFGTSTRGRGTRGRNYGGATGRFPSSSRQQSPYNHRPPANYGGNLDVGDHSDGRNQLRKRGQRWPRKGSHGQRHPNSRIRHVNPSSCGQHESNSQDTEIHVGFCEHERQLSNDDNSRHSTTQPESDLSSKSRGCTSVDHMGHLPIESTPEEDGSTSKKPSNEKLMYVAMNTLGTGRKSAARASSPLTKHWAVAGQIFKKCIDELKQPRNASIPISEEPSVSLHERPKEQRNGQSAVKTNKEDESEQQFLQKVEQTRIGFEKNVSISSRSQLEASVEVGRHCIQVCSGENKPLDKQAVFSDGNKHQQINHYNKNNKSLSKSNAAVKKCLRSKDDQDSLATKELEQSRSEAVSHLCSQLNKNALEPGMSSENASVEHTSVTESTVGEPGMGSGTASRLSHKLNPSTLGRCGFKMIAGSIQMEANHNPAGESKSVEPCNQSRMRQRPLQAQQSGNHHQRNGHTRGVRGGINPKRKAISTDSLNPCAPEPNSRATASHTTRGRRSRTHRNGSHEHPQRTLSSSDTSKEQNLSHPRCFATAKDCPPRVVDNDNSISNFEFCTSGQSPADTLMQNAREMNTNYQKVPEKAHAHRIKSQCSLSKHREKDSYSQSFHHKDDLMYEKPATPISESIRDLTESGEHPIPCNNSHRSTPNRCALTKRTGGKQRPRLGPLGNRDSRSSKQASSFQIKAVIPSDKKSHELRKDRPHEKTIGGGSIRCSVDSSPEDVNQSPDVSISPVSPLNKDHLLSTAIQATCEQPSDQAVHIGPSVEAGSAGTQVEDAVSLSEEQVGRRWKAPHQRYGCNPQAGLAPFDTSGTVCNRAQAGSIYPGGTYGSYVASPGLRPSRQTLPRDDNDEASQYRMKMNDRNPQRGCQSDGKLWYPSCQPSNMGLTYRERNECNQRPYDEQQNSCNEPGQWHMGYEGSAQQANNVNWNAQGDREIQQIHRSQDLHCEANGTPSHHNRYSDAPYRDERQGQFSDYQDRPQLDSNREGLLEDAPPFHSVHLCETPPSQRLRNHGSCFRSSYQNLDFRELVWNTPPAPPTDVPRTPPVYHQPSLSDTRQQEESSSSGADQETSVNYMLPKNVAVCHSSKNYLPPPIPTVSEEDTEYGSYTNAYSDHVSVYDISLPPTPKDNSENVDSVPQVPPRATQGDAKSIAADDNHTSNSGAMYPVTQRCTTSPQGEAAVVSPLTTVTPKGSPDDCSQQSMQLPEVHKVVDYTPNTQVDGCFAPALHTSDGLSPMQSLLNISSVEKAPSTFEPSSGDLVRCVAVVLKPKTLQENAAVEDCFEKPCGELRPAPGMASAPSASCSLEEEKQNISKGEAEVNDGKKYYDWFECKPRQGNDVETKKSTLMKREAYEIPKRAPTHSTDRRSLDSAMVTRDRFEYQKKNVTRKFSPHQMLERISPTATQTKTPSPTSTTINYISAPRFTDSPSTSHCVTPPGRPLGNSRQGRTRWSDPLRRSFSPVTSKDRTVDFDPLWKNRFKAHFENVETSYIDTHCHIDFMIDRGEFIGSFEQYRYMNKDTFPTAYAGCVAVFCDPRTFKREGKWQDILNDPIVVGAIGCHPKSATNFSSYAQRYMEEMLRHPKVVALGEIGLDYSNTFSQHKEIQQKVFEEQISMALELKLPLVIHCRDAEEDCFEILSKKVPRNHPIHRHCFTGSWREAQRWLNHFDRLYIGLTPLITNPRGRGFAPREVASNIPLNRLLLETDAPYFVPRMVPRGAMQWSHPGMAITVADEVASLRRISIEEVLSACLENTADMYRIRPDNGKLRIISPKDAPQVQQTPASSNGADSKAKSGV